LALGNPMSTDEGPSGSGSKCSLNVKNPKKVSGDASRPFGPKFPLAGSQRPTALGPWSVYLAVLEACFRYWRYRSPHPDRLSAATFWWKRTTHHFNLRVVSGGIVSGTQRTRTSASGVCHSKRCTKRGMRREGYFKHRFEQPSWSCVQRRSRR